MNQFKPSCYPGQLNPQNNDLDNEFIQLMLQIEENYQCLPKHEKIRIELWTRKLCQVTTNDVWKKNRNLYARIMLNQVLKQKLSEPFDKRPPEGPLPKLNKYSLVIKQNCIQKQQQGTKENKSNSKYIISEKQPLYQRDENFYPDQIQVNQDLVEEFQQQLNQQQQIINSQQMQINQINDFNEKLVKLIIACRAYMDPINDPECEELKQQQDQLFQWMHDQSQLTYDLQQGNMENKNISQNQLEQIDEQAEEQETNYNDEEQGYSYVPKHHDDQQFLQYLDNFEKKTERLKKETENCLKLSNQFQNREYSYFK